MCWIIDEIRRQDMEDLERKRMGLPLLDAKEPDYFELYTILSADRVPTKDTRKRAASPTRSMPKRSKPGVKEFPEDTLAKEIKKKQRKTVSVKRGPNDAINHLVHASGRRYGDIEQSNFPAKLLHWKDTEDETRTATHA